VHRRLASLSCLLLIAVLVDTASLTAQTRVTSPNEQFGFAIGDDYHLANYTQFAAYWEKLAAESPRMVLDTIGLTAEGRHQLMAIVTSPANHRRLARYREISQRLALAEGVTEEQARTLAREGKAVVWIDGGLHATEVLGAHQLMETVYQLVSMDDAETRRILDDVIVLGVHANPDGMELVSNWYMRESEPTQRSTRGIPRLYQKYIGHDNNRDFYMVAQPETENMNRIMFTEWLPQILYNHHQTGPSGTIMFAPPFRDPANYNYDPLVLEGIEAVGAAMHNRFMAEGKGGVTRRRGASYSTWWNGGLRTTAYFHNIIGLLTETVGNPTPIEIPFVPSRHLPSLDNPMAIAPQPWHFRQSVDYSVTANRAVLDYASRYRETLLMNIYRMARNSIERGSRDHWTIHPTMIQAVEDSLTRLRDAQRGQERFFRGAPTELFQMLRDPADRDPRGYILPAAQPDFPTATKFVNALIKNGVTVHRSTRAFTVHGKRYTAGSYVVLTAQAFRPHILDMFEPQDHPNDFAYEGGPPIPPYDNAGWTLAFQMGVSFDRILDGFDGPFERIDGLAAPPAVRVADAPSGGGWVIRHAVNDAAIVTNRLLAAGQAVYWVTRPIQADGRTYAAGSIYVPSTAAAREIVQRAGRELGVDAHPVAAPGGDALQLNPVRIGLWDRYGGSMPSGWTRWLLEQFEFPFEVVFPQRLDAGNLREAFDVLVFVDGGIPSSDRAGGFGGFGSFDDSSIPAEYRDRLGRVSVETTVPKLMEFLRSGGTVITIGSSTAMAAHAGLPLSDHLVDAAGESLGREEYYIPGSVLRVRVDNTQPLAYGMPEQVDVFFDNSPVFRLAPNAPAQVNRVAWFDSAVPLRSGWAWGKERLQGGVAVAEASIGDGRLYLFGPEILHRAQPHGTFKLLFNGIHMARAQQVPLQ
jgi:hypothetical protein